MGAKGGGRPIQTSYPHFREQQKPFRDNTRARVHTTHTHTHARTHAQAYLSQRRQARESQQGGVASSSSNAVLGLQGAPSERPTPSLAARPMSARGAASQPAQSGPSLARPATARDAV